MMNKWTLLVILHVILNLIFDAACCPAGCLCYLKIVSCTNVGLNEIPAQEIPSQTTALVLRGNKIRRIKQDDLVKVPNLKRLFLSNNKITGIDPGAFFPLKKLEHLNLNGNNLKSLDADTFSGLFNLEQLYIHQNNIANISHDAFLDLGNLKRLYLWGNRIERIHKQTLQPLISLKHLRFENNRLICDCDLYFTINDFVQKHSTQVVASCFKPRNRRGRILSTLKKKDLGCDSRNRPISNEVTEDITASPGTTVSISCNLEKVRNPYVVWKKNGRGLSLNERFFINENGTLNILEVRFADVGTYECRYGGFHGRLMARAKLNIAGQETHPVFVKKSKNVEVISGNTARLICRAKGFPRPNIIWRKGGKLLQQKPRYKALTNGDLEISPVQSDDHGYFTCEARNSIGSVSHTMRLIVTAPPSFTRAPQDVTVLEGNTVTLECVATGYPQPTIAWHKDGDRLPSDGRHFVLPSGSLRIIYVSKENEGTYQCQGINVIGVNIARATIKVRGRVHPTILSKPEDTTVRAGNTIYFQCKSNGAPEPIISWIKDGVQVSDSNRFHLNSSTGILEIRNIGKVDEGRWQCAARNSIGYASEVFTLRVIGPESGKYEGDEFVKNSVERARIEIDKAISKTREKLKDLEVRTPGDLLKLFRFPSPEALRLGRAAEIFETALKFIQEKVDFKQLNLDGQPGAIEPNLNNLVSPDQIAMLANLSGCTAHQHATNCSDLCFHMKFRTYDSSCNNLKNPMWGAALTPFARLLSPIYENGFNTPVGWSNTVGKPSARLVSLEVISTVNVTDDKDLTHMSMQWGQFLDHDITFQVTTPSSNPFVDGDSCDSTCKKEHPCFPIEVPKNDHRIRRKKCLGFTRSSAVCGSGSTSVFFNVITPRQQINQITSYIDASNVYGSTKHEAREIRDLSNKKGFLKTGYRPQSGKPFLPYNTDLPIDCQVNKSESKVPCFLAGDHRANEQLGLLAMHTIWLREHNRLAIELSKLNPHWDSEELYHTARKIVGAEMQHITYTAWLPKILGKIGLEHLGDYQGYNPNTDASVFNAFATAAFRFGHSLIQPFMARLNSSFMPTVHGTLPLHKAFFSPSRLINEGGPDPLLRGLFATAAKSRLDTGQVMNNELTDRLFEMAHEMALDLAALNIQRGRDHGIPGYNSWRQYCNLTLAESFDDFKKEIKNEGIREKLEQLYLHPDNVDLFVGGMVEDPIPGSRLGPLFMCLITHQFKRLREGDRFWYENPGVFKPEQLTQIKQVSLARIICDNSDNIKNVQRDVFSRAQSHAEYLPCPSIPSLDIRFWKDCCPENDNCQAKDKSFTVTNFLQRRSRRSVFSADENYDNSTSPHLNSIDEEKDVLQEHTVTNTTKKLQNKIARLENKLKEVTTILEDLKTEVAEMKHSIASNTLMETDCEDEFGITRKNSETWKSTKGEYCSCENGMVLCEETDG